MFSKFYYKRKLKSYKTARQINRVFLNIEDVKHLVVAVECRDIEEFKVIQKDISHCLQGIPKVSLLCFFDVNFIEEYAASSNEVLLFRGDLLRKLTPKDEMVKRIDALKPDVFINLNRKSSPVIDFLTEISTAGMRVGFEEKTVSVELILAVSSENGYQPFFEKMQQVLKQINAK